MSTPTVHILATCHEEAGLNAATLVFQTLRVGFPTTRIEVTVNTMENDLVERIGGAAGGVGAVLADREWELKHDDWIRDLARYESDPFWICDTDVVFWDSVEELTSEAPLLGRWQPGFADPATGCETVPRLHTSLLRIDPVKFRAEAAKYEANIRLKHFAPPADYWAPIVLPGFPRPRFYNCGAVAYHALGGESFSEADNARFDHLHNATYLDEIAPLIPDADLRTAHAQVYQNPALLRGAHVQQMEWFNKHRF